MAVPWNFISEALGWIYFSCWAVSFYPQVNYNYKKKSVTGLSIDFVLGNLVGFIYLSIYTGFLYYSPTIKAQYRETHENTENLVQINDLAFAFHACLLSFVFCIQVLLYRKPNEGLSLSAKIIFVALLLYNGALVKWLWEGSMSALEFLYCLSNLKIIFTILKYIPQVVLNYQRKSTVGWSISNVLLDFCGGVFSLTQLVLDGFLLGNVREGIIGDSVKFWLAIVSIFYDVIFMIQHFILYKKVWHDDEENHDTAPKSSQGKAFA